METIENETADLTKAESEFPDVLSALNKSVAVKIAGSTTQVVDSVVDQFVNQEINRRTEALFKAIVETNKLRDEFKKVKPDQVSYDETGKVVLESWSKAKLEERKKAQEAIKKKEKAIEKALAGDFSQLLNG